MDLLSAKIIIGKKVESDLATYMQQNEEELRQKFIRVYPFVKLEPNANGRIIDIEEMVRLLARALIKLIEKEQGKPFGAMLGLLAKGELFNLSSRFLSPEMLLLTQ